MINLKRKFSNERFSDHGLSAASVNGRHEAALLVVFGALACVGVSRQDARAWTQRDPLALDCDAVRHAVLTALFTPARPQLGRYEVCTTRESLAALVRPDWRIETVPPLDAFGAAGAYAGALARLRGRRATPRTRVTARRSLDPL